MILIEHMVRQIGFSKKTFGPGPRLNGVANHIRKELLELGAAPDDLEQAILDHGDYRAYPPVVMDIIRKRQMVRGGVVNPGSPDEWVDVVLLALDGFWRSLAHESGYNLTAAEIAEIICEKLDNKQTKNENRGWPDWRTMSADRAIEHVRTGETA